MKSKPLGAATEQTILRFIYEQKIPCSPVYGECIYDEETDTYKFTGEQRTGCKLCGFGLKFDPERYVRLQKLEPNVVTFAFTDRDRGGLGYMEVCTFLNEHCDMNIAIPEIEQGYYEKRALAYKEKERGDQMAKRILSAFIEQSLQFDCRTDYEAHVQDLKRGKFKYSLNNFRTDEEGKVYVTVRKQYNNNAFPDDLEGGEKKDD